MESQTRACYVEEKASDCLRLMNDANLEFLLVLDRRVQLVGMITRRDLVRTTASDMQVRAIMSTKLLRCEPNEDVRAVASKMSSTKMDVAIVTENEVLVGVLTMKGLVQKP